MKRTVASVLALVIAFSCILCSCNNNTSPNHGAVEQPNRGNVIDNVPALDYNGETVVILVRDYDVYEKEVFAENITGEPLNDSIYNREQITEERLNVKIESFRSKDVYETVSLSVKSGFDDYQIAGNTPNDIDVKTYMENGVFSNLMDKERFPYIDFTRPWYSQIYVDSAEYNGALYFLPSELSLSWLQYMSATFFNKTIAENIGLSDTALYQLVRDGKWTLDKQLQYSAMAYTDVTGNGKTEDDIYGIGFGNMSGIDPYMSSFEMTFAEYDSDGVPLLSLDTAKHTAILEKLYDLIYNTKDAYVIDDVQNNWGYAKFQGEEDKVALKFAQEELLFATIELFTAGNTGIRNMNSAYGIIPMPKWEESQDGYYSYSARQHTVWSIPTTVQNPEMVSAVFEVLNSYSYQYVTPIYYNNLLNGQYTRDLESTEMIDIITSSYRVDFVMVYDYALDRFTYDSVRNLIVEENSTNVTRFWRANGRRIEKEYEKLIGIFKQLKELGN